MTKAKNTFFIGAVAALAMAAPALADSIVNVDASNYSTNTSDQATGKRYSTAKQVVQAFSQTGRASWYGPGFHGRKAANGEIFNMNAMTAAHRTLPLNSYARVTNLSNGKSIVVRVTDRGPYSGNRVMDLSRAGAMQLGFISAGTANVRVERVGPGQSQTDLDSTNLAAAPVAKNIYVSLASFNNKDEASTFVQRTSAYLRASDSSHRIVMKQQSGNYVVQMGPFKKQVQPLQSQI